MVCSLVSLGWYSLLTEAAQDPYVHIHKWLRGEAPLGITESQVFERESVEKWQLFQLRGTPSEGGRDPSGRSSQRSRQNGLLLARNSNDKLVPFSWQRTLSLSKVRKCVRFMPCTQWDKFQGSVGGTTRVAQAQRHRRRCHETDGRQIK